MKAAVIGTGKMGENHLKNYIEMSDYCEVVGIYDVNENKAKEVSEKYNVKYFTSITELLGKVDAVSIAVPTDFHYEIGALCIQKGVHALIEKPITSNVNQAKKLIKRAKEKGVIVQVGHIELYNPLIQLLKERLKDEKIIAIDIHRMQPLDSRVLEVDVVLDLMIHDVYILKEIMQDEIKQFETIGKTMEFTPKHAVMIALFQNGAVAQMTASFQSQEKIRSIRIFTETGIYKADLLGNKIEIIRKSEFSIANGERCFPQKVSETILIPEYNPLKSQLQDFIHCAKHKKTPYVTVEDGVEVLEICLDISKKIKQLSDGKQI